MIEDFDPIQFTLSETSKMLHQNQITPSEAQKISFETIKAILVKAKLPCAYKKPSTFI
tara:strand:+ start:184 stop:357 length:174 start_codon:yes stop_codon:yes gene_type:complete